MKREIEEVLERDVRPVLMSHEGDVRLVSYENGILKVRLTGKCSGCPSAQLTTEEVIAKTVKGKVPEVQEVILVNQVSEELLDMAKKLLSHRSLA